MQTFEDGIGDTRVRGDVANELGSRVAEAVAKAYGVEITVEGALIRPAAPERDADYQSNAAMSLAKQVGSPSRDVATAIAEHLDTTDLVEPPEVAGPGFINFRLRTDWLEAHAAALVADPRLGVPLADEPRRVVIDYSAPNVAKEMLVHHLRSTIIGDAIGRLHRFQGHEVVPQNHLGDWGTPFGMLLEHLADESWTAGSEHTIGDLNAFYQEARQKFDADAGFNGRARQRVVALQAGDPATLELWQGLVAESQRHFEEVYDLLGVLLRPEHYRGESFYNAMLPEVVAELEAKGLARESEGALCAFPAGFTNRDGDPMPLIVRKSDGGYTYDTTDLAAIRYRARDLSADDFLYVVGAPQRLHFDMIFAVAREAGWLPEHARVAHVSFGSMLGEDGKMLRTRSGAPIRLVDLLHEAVDRAGVIIAERGELSDDERRRVAHAVGVGAVKYADLASDREKDYVFSWPRMLAMDGNTAVYLQYANTRVRSVIRKAGLEAAPDAAVVLEEPAERALALKLAQLPAAVESVAATLQPHKLCNYLYDTAAAFTTFYESCPVLRAGSDELRDSRLVLCELTSRTLVQGLGLLGIEAPDRL